MKLPTKEYLRGIIETMVEDYQEHQSNKEIIEIEILESGEFEFKVKLWFHVSETKSDYELFVVLPDFSKKQIRELVDATMDYIKPFKS